MRVRVFAVYYYKFKNIYKRALFEYFTFSVACNNTINNSRVRNKRSRSTINSAACICNNIGISLIEFISRDGKGGERKSRTRATEIVPDKWLIRGKNVGRSRVIESAMLKIKI